eukprot:4772387-Heterocapsa_arctica.AAC.1
MGLAARSWIPCVFFYHVCEHVALSMHGKDTRFVSLHWRRFDAEKIRLRVIRTRRRSPPPRPHPP